MTMRVLEARMLGYGPTTAHMLYRRPDRPALLRSFVWQMHDLAPDFPRLNDFLDHWRRDISALYSVRIFHKGLMLPAEWIAADGLITLH